MAETKRFPWVEILVFLALGAIIFSVVQPNFADYSAGTKTALCKENQRNIEQAVLLWLTLKGESRVERGVGAEGEGRITDSFGDTVEGMLHYSDTHPNARELVDDLGLDPAIFYCPEVGEDDCPLGRHYCYRNSQGTVECAVDAEGKARQLADEPEPGTDERKPVVDYFHD
jgi:hypothetical protein